MGAKGWILLLKQLYRASFLSATKSVVNLWLSSFMQIFFYIAQYLFWMGIGEHQSILKGDKLLGFFVTMALVDNVYLMLFGPGSILAQQLILGRRLEQVLLIPRSPLVLLTLSRPNLAFAPCCALSLGFFAVYLTKVQPSFTVVITFLLASMMGVIILNLISFIYRLSSFWTAAIVQIRNSNPSFKIMVRPLEAFSGKLRFCLMTLFPALFITGVPSKILTDDFGKLWLLYGFGATLWLSVVLLWLWRMGLRRYGVTAI